MAEAMEFRYLATFLSIGVIPADKTAVPVDREPAIDAAFGKHVAIKQSAARDFANEFRRRRNADVPQIKKSREAGRAKLVVEKTQLQERRAFRGGS